MKDDYFKPGYERSIIAIFSIIIFSFILRFYQLSFFEFKNDQLQAIICGDQTRNVGFLITHGLGSGVGVSNPQLFLWFMGLVTFFTHDPLAITAVFTVFNLCALCLAIRYFYLYLPLTYALLASIFLAFSPAFTVYSNIIWAQCLLPLVMVLFNFNLYRFIKEERAGRYFLGLTILACLAAQLHMSGFFLFPVLLILTLIHRDKVKAKTLFLSLIIALIIFLPYLVHLFREGEFARVYAYGALAKRHVYWKLFREHLRMSSFDFFRYYFREDFNQVLKSSAGPLRYILYPFSCLLIGFFVFSFLSYLSWLARSRAFFNLSPETLKKYPLPFQISGFLIFIISASYLIFKVQTPMHYFIILFPSYSIFLSFCAYRLWQYRLGRYIVFLALTSTILLMLAVFVFLERSGGHPREYGLSYRQLLIYRKDINGLMKKGECPAVKIEFKGKGKSDTEAALYAITGISLCGKNYTPVPVSLTVNWDKELMRYERTIKIGK
ncbi:MAG TPA: glycosyltransferase family 39 protein [Candidatus Margulisiibacteriota bacterium]|nr:glycosyltransferase family 39 protein [Candidatus Margulisiibacteriota bacterium]